MNETVICVERLSKQYRIGHREADYTTLRDVLWQTVASPLRRLRNWTRAGNGEDSLWALRDVSFEVKRGEVVGLIGRNGAGKSTFLKVLSRITEPTSGRVLLKGRVASLLEVGTGFHAELTGRENIFLNGAILGMSKAEIRRKFDEIVAFSEVETHIDTPVKHYSSGMYLRLAFAVAAHLEPEILIVDEVLAVGDACFQKKCLGKMGDAAKEGRTVLLVSHNMGAITNLCRTSLCFENGRLVDAGDTQKVVAAYLGRAEAGVGKEGHSDLRTAPRANELQFRHAQFDWVRTLKSTGQTAGTFLEGEAMQIETGFRLTRNAGLLELGIGLSSPDIYSELFTVPTELPGQWRPGHYRIRLNLDPNHLRAGIYRITLKMFADGVRQDTLGETLQMAIINRLSEQDVGAYSKRWVAGRFRFDYRWEPVEAVSSVPAATC